MQRFLESFACIQGKCGSGLDKVDFDNSPPSLSQSQKLDYSTESRVFNDDTQLIPVHDIHATLLHQYREEKISNGIEIESNCYGQIEPARSSRSLFSDASSTNSGMFSAKTEHAGNQNKYVAATTQESSPKRLKKKKGKIKLSGERYSSASSLKDDWDYSLRLQDERIHLGATDQIDDRDTRVLHLKMKAPMVEFYAKEFLLINPHLPAPKQMRMQPFCRKPIHKYSDRLPEVVSADSDTSASTANSEKPCEDVNIFSNPIKLVIDDSPFLNLVISGCMGLIDRQRTQPMHHSNQLMKNFILLKNEGNGLPLAICSLKSTKGKPVVRIYTSRPRKLGQKPVICASNLGITKHPYSLYTWAELRTIGEFPSSDAKYVLCEYNWEQLEFCKTPTYMVSHSSPGSTELNIFGQQNHDGKTYPLNLCARMVVRNEMIRGNQESNYIISVQKDTDIVNILCVAAIVDELMEFMMRKYCAMQAWKFTNE